MKAASARSSRAKDPFSTTKRAPASRAAVWKSIRPRDSPSSKCWRGALRRAAGTRCGIAMAAELDIRRLVRAFRHFRRREIGDRRQQGIDNRPLLALGLLGRRHRFLDLGDLGRGGNCRLRLALAPQPSDLFGQAVAPGLHLFEDLLQAPALLIELQNRCRLRRQPTAPQPLVEGARIIANGFQVVHLPTSCKIRVQGYRLGNS